ELLREVVPSMSEVGYLFNRRCRPGRRQISDGAVPWGFEPPVAMVRRPPCHFTGQDDIRCQRDQFRRVLAIAVSVASAPARLDPHVAAVGPAQSCLVTEVRSASILLDVAYLRAQQWDEHPYTTALIEPGCILQRRGEVLSQDQLS